MEIIKNEIKKVFNFTNLVVVGIISLIIWNLFISFEIEYFPNGSDNYYYNNSVYMLKNYGISMDEDEFKDFKKVREEKVKEADEYLSSREEYVKAGLSTYKDFYKVYQSEPFVDEEPNNAKEQQRLINKAIFDDNVEIFWELEAIYYDIDRYENKESWIYNLAEYKNISESKLKFYNDRHNELVESKNAYSPLNWVIMRNYNSLIVEINLLIIITVSIMVSPIYINDNKNNVNYLQYTSKEGRRLFNKKIIAGVISSITIVTVQLAIFFIIYKLNNTYMFWDCSINSALSDIQSWFNLTFGEYIIITVLLTYIVGIVVGIISMYVSSKVKTYISLIGIQIPILFVFYGLLKSIGINNVTSMYYPKYTIHFIYVTLILISIFTIKNIVKKEKKLDI